MKKFLVIAALASMLGGCANLAGVAGFMHRVNDGMKCHTHRGYVDSRGVFHPIQRPSDQECSYWLDR